MKSRALLAAVLVCLVCAGCGRSSGSDDFIKPSIAVMKFENRAPFVMKWNLGDGMRDVLVDRLMATGKYHVIERGELNYILDELRLQQSGATRKQDRAALGRGKNVRYLIKGTVTDFGHVSSASGYGGTSRLRIFGGGARAVMGMTLYVVDVETFEVIASESISGSVRSGEVDVKSRYRGVAFGGNVFYQTPLGKATKKGIDRAVDRISKTIAGRPWVPRIAGVAGQDRRVTINGGKNRRVEWGSEFEILQLGPPIIDPDTGDMLGREASKVLGRIRIREVHDRFAVAEVLRGNCDSFESGLPCRRVPSPLDL